MMSITEKIVETLNRIHTIKQCLTTIVCQTKKHHPKIYNCSFLKWGITLEEEVAYTQIFPTTCLSILIRDLKIR